jgi:hypothetical protein
VKKYVILILLASFTLIGFNRVAMADSEDGDSAYEAACLFFGTCLGHS